MIPEFFPNSIDFVTPGHCYFFLSSPHSTIRVTLESCRKVRKKERSYSNTNTAQKLHSFSEKLRKDKVHSVVYSTKQRIR